MNTSKDEEARTAILDAARRVFQRWGLNKTTMEDIAHEAGKGKSTLYYYYKNKDEIFDTVVKIEISALLSRAKSSVQEIPSAKEKLKKYVAASISEIRNTALLYDIVRGEIRGNPHFIQSVSKEFQPQEVRFVKDILFLGVQQKEFSFSDEEELNTAAQVVVEIIRALELHLFLGAYDSRHVDIAAKLIAYGL
jgi:AcrR family transcriptional regulator